MQGEFILKAADYYYAEILKNLPSPAEFEDDLIKLKPKLLEVIRNLKKYETAIRTFGKESFQFVRLASFALMEYTGGRCANFFA